MTRRVLWAALFAAFCTVSAHAGTVPSETTAAKSEASSEKAGTDAVTAETKAVEAPKQTKSALSSKEAELKTRKKKTAASAAAVSAKASEAAAPASVPAKQTKVLEKKFFAPALSKEDEKLTGETKVLHGRLSAIGPMGIGVSYDKNLKAGTDKEMWLNFQMAMKFKGAKSIADFSEGDEVSVTYLDAVRKEKREDREVVVDAKRILQELRLIRKAPAPAPDEAESAETEDETAGESPA